MEHSLPIVQFLRGGTMVALFGIAVFFLRYWRQTKDRLFAYFTVAFLLMAVCQIMVLLIGEKDEHAPYAYWMRLVAFLLIIAAIVEKNTPGKKTERNPDSSS